MEILEFPKQGKNVTMTIHLNQGMEFMISETLKQRTFL